MFIGGVEIEMIRYALSTACEEMGIALRKSAYSPNIKERADYTCAMFDPEGRLLATAEHIPVHLGSFSWGMKQTLKAIQEASKEIQEGEMWILNDPYLTGTHLNDVMVIRPVFYQGIRVAYVANKAHYVDVGGKHAGGISILSTSLEDEGWVIPPTLLMRNNRVNADFFNSLLRHTRLPDWVKGDLQAQISANFLGERHILELLNRYPLEDLQASFTGIFDSTEQLTRAHLSQFPSNLAEAEDVLELPSERGFSTSFPVVWIRASIQFSKGSVKIQFFRTSQQVSYPLNAVYGVTLSACYYVVKCLLPLEVPVNDGFFRCVKVEAEEGSLVHPRYPAPVAGGNLETSQRIVDVLLRALSHLLPDRVPAASCGSMNNVVVSGKDPITQEEWAFYETNGGGAGACPLFHGPSAVHTHMTNTQNTPIEVLEHNYPIQFLRYEIREGSGGEGRWRGGEGIRRAWKLLSAGARVSLFADRSRFSPYGLAGGLPGSRSEFFLVHKGENPEPLQGKQVFEMEAEDEFWMETAGGGGWGHCKCS